MKELHLTKVQHDKKVGHKVDELIANVTEDTLFMEDGVVIGFYIADLSKLYPKASQLAGIADKELRTDRVPKTEMSRGPQGNKKQKLQRQRDGKNLVTQYSTILGGVPPKPHMRRDYPTVSSVHSVSTAKNFVKAMILLAKESESIIRDIMPAQYELQKKLISSNCPEKYRLTDLFTSSISNYNISADYHIDKANLKDCVNVIIAKRKDSIGGNTTVPDYNATVDSSDGSMLVYPAWRNLHGVTPIRETAKGGYRNTLVFYPLGSFKKYVGKQ
jgi:hypothetical protein